MCSVTLQIKSSRTAKVRVYSSVNNVITGSDNGVSPVGRYAAMWPDVGYCLLHPSEQILNKFR